MQNVLWILILAAVTLVLFRHIRNREDVSVFKEIWHVGEEFDESARIYDNCTLPSCFDLQRCMLEYDFLTVYVEPLITIVSEDGTVISPIPSQEFLELRQSLRPYAVASVNNSCIVVPGVDFLNAHRFKSSSHLNLVMYHVFQRYKNVLVFTMTPVSAFSRAVIASPSPFPTQFRHQFDISIPVFPHVHEVLQRVEKDKGRILLPLINASTSVITEYSKLTQKIEELYVVSECNDDIASMCDKDGNRLGLSLEQLIMRFDTVILDGDIPLFPHLISLSFKYGLVPVIVSRGRILPYSTIQDWNKISVLAVSVPHIANLLNKLDDSQKRRIRLDVQRYHDRHLSSLPNIVKDSITILTSRILPTQQIVQATKFNEYAVQVPQIIPHISLSEKVNVIMLLENMNNASVQTKINSIYELTSIETITIFLNDTDLSVTVTEHLCSHTLHIIHGNPSADQIYNLAQRRNSKSQAYLIIEEPICNITEEKLRESIAIWRVAPQQIHESEACKTMKIYHKTLLQH